MKQAYVFLEIDFQTVKIYDPREDEVRIKGIDEWAKPDDGTRPDLKGRALHYYLREGFEPFCKPTIHKTFGETYYLRKLVLLSEEDEEVAYKPGL